jgi:hypothetical protein
VLITVPRPKTLIGPALRDIIALPEHMLECGDNNGDNR